MNRRTWALFWVFAGLILQALHPSSAGAQQAPPERGGAEFQAFWESFRTGVLANDTEKIAALTHFPFQTRGSMDGDPIRKHDRKSFLMLLPKLLNSDPGFSTRPDTMRALIERSATSTKPSDRAVVSGTWARIGDFEFRKLRGRWRFVLAYWQQE